MRRDPVFNIFTIPPVSSSAEYFKKFLIRTNPGMISFSENLKRIKCYPVCYKPDKVYEMPLHSHDFFEVLLVISGRGEHINNRNYTEVIKNRDIIIINNQSAHSLRGLDSEFEVINLTFLPSAIGYSDDSLRNRNLSNLIHFLRPFNEYDARGNFIKIRQPDADFKKILFYAFHIIELFHKGMDKNAEIICNLLSTIINMIFNHYKAQNNINGAGNNIYMMDIYSWLHANFQKKISLGGMARHLQISEPYFSTLFNKITGKNLKTCVNEIRIGKSREMLENTGFPVGRIAYEVGFEDITHFNFVFKKYVGCSPSRYRKQINTAGTIPLNIKTI
ncbi:MAG: hypothetical protein A2096_12130 [Spirochaetes bacterium GWF1_41_5]|nr:MAG: hypothetical protein A2096_12130 [Spirochaetes bacterium GWF1_41_5]